MKVPTDSLWLILSSSQTRDLLTPHSGSCSSQEALRHVYHEQKVWSINNDMSKQVQWGWSGGNRTSESALYFQSRCAEFEFIGFLHVCPHAGSFLRNLLCRSLNCRGRFWNVCNLLMFHQQTVDHICSISNTPAFKQMITCRNNSCWQNASYPDKSFIGLPRPPPTPKILISGGSFRALISSLWKSIQTFQTDGKL